MKLIHGIKGVMDRHCQISFGRYIHYYKEKVNTTVAKKLVKGIIDRTIQLQHNPNSGPKEPLLSHQKYEYRYLVEGNYKINYWVENNLIKIAAVFDCRHNPDKMNII